MLMVHWHKKKKSSRAYAAIAVAWRGQLLYTGWELNVTRLSAVTAVGREAKNPLPSACFLLHRHIPCLAIFLFHPLH